MLAIIAAASLVAGSHVRSEDAVIGAALRDDLLRSTVIQRLVEVIDASNVIVYLARGDCPRPAIACVISVDRRHESVERTPVAARPSDQQLRYPGIRHEVLSALPLTARLPSALAALIVAPACPSEALASDESMKEVIVQVVPLPGIDPGILTEATAIVERIYGAFGVRLHLSADAEPSADGRTPWRRIVIKPSATKHFASAFGTSSVMGLSPRNGDAPGRVAYVFYDAISQTARRHDLPIYALLGYAMAHELGHQLLPANAHGKAGVMRGNWDSNDMKMMRAGTLAMADRESALVWHYLDSLGESR